METLDAVLEFALLALFVGICGYAVRLIFKTMRGDEATRARWRAESEGQKLTVVDAHRTVEALIEAVASPPQPDLAEALEHLTQAVLEEPALAAQRRAELTEVLQDLTEAAETPADSRRTGRIHAEVELLGQVARTAPGFGRAWSTWGPVVSDHLLERS